MTNPAGQTIALDTWTKVATAVSKGQIWFYDSTCDYYHTYRDTGDPAPTLDPTNEDNAFSEGVKRIKQRTVGGAADISTLVSSDIYIYCSKTAGRIVVEV